MSTNEKLQAISIPDSMLDSSAISWSKSELREGLRELLAIYSETLGCSHDAAVHFLCARIDKTKHSVYAWLTDSPKHAAISWPLMDLLRIEAALLSSSDEVKARFKNMLKAYEAKWQEENIARARAKTRVKVVTS